MEVKDEIKGIIVNGEEVSGITPTGGWGSNFRIQLDNETGEIDYATRVESPQDLLF